MDEQGYKKVINDILVEMFHDILRVEQKTIERDTDAPLTMAELHIIEVVGGMNEHIMSDVARKLRITLPTLTASVDRLEQKGFIRRQRSREDRRKVAIELTEAGQHAFLRHAGFHESMVNAFVEGISADRVPELVESITRLRDFFRRQAEQLDQ